MGVGEMLALRRRLRGVRVDVAIDLQGLIKSGVIAAATSAPLRVGFARGWGREPLGALFTNRHVIPPPVARHVVEQYLALLEPLGIRERRLGFRLPSVTVAGARLADLLGPGRRQPPRR